MGVLTIVVILIVFMVLAWAAWTYLTIAPPPIRGLICFLIILIGVMIILNGTGAINLGSVNLRR